MTDAASPATRRSYDRVASHYAERFEHELDDKPFDRTFLDAVLAISSKRGSIIDLGCGPGQIGRYLAERGLHVLGIDLSFEMLKRSRALLGTGQVQADMRTLPFASASIEGVVAFYSVIHVPPRYLHTTIREITRVVVPGGFVALTSHVAPPGAPSGRSEAVGDAPWHLDELLSAPVDLDFYFYGANLLIGLLEGAGFGILSGEEREPYAPAVEAQTRRAYILARKTIR